MRRFNPEKELNKIQRGNKNKVMFGVIALLLIISIGSTYALYQVRYSKRIIYTKVAPFSSKDINIAVFIDNKNVANFPKKEDGKVYDKIECDDNKDNHVKAYFDSDTWNLEVDTNDKAKCNVYFKTPEKYQDTSGANPPELYQGLIPVKYGENGEVIVADTTKEWYDYEKHEWANAVLVNKNDDTIVKDLSGNGNYATIAGGAQIVNGELVLDGDDDGIFLGDMVKDLFTHSSTFQVKLKRTELSRAVVVLGNYAGGVHIQFEIVGNTFYIFGQGSQPHGGTFNFNDEFVTLTYVYNREEGNIKIYIDDKLEYTAVDNVYKTMNLNFSGAYVGRSQIQTGSSGRTFKGSIEKVMIYNDILTDQEIQQNLKAESGEVGGSGLVKDNLYLYYDFKVPQEIDTTPEKILNMNAVSQMYVWIPRYKYQLFNVNNGGISSQMIHVKFETGTQSTGNVSCTTNQQGKEECLNAANGNWYTHPAFTFGNTQLTGIWVGKFESSGTKENIIIKPNMNPLRSIDLSTMFNASRDIEINYAGNYNLKSSEVDTHIAKNMDWGAMTYLTQSKYGICSETETCEKIKTNSVEFTTGYASANEMWDTANGVKASTTGNIYGIYDTNGGSWEYVMGNMLSSSSFFAHNSGFTNPPNEKYYDKYEYSTSNLDHQRGHLGDATKETLLIFGKDGGGWNGEISRLAYNRAAWLCRSGGYSLTTASGPSAFAEDTGGPVGHMSFRVVLTAQDGIDEVTEES